MGGPRRGERGRGAEAQRAEVQGGAGGGGAEGQRGRGAEGQRRKGAKGQRCNGAEGQGNVYFQLPDTKNIHFYLENTPQQQRHTPDRDSAYPFKTAKKCNVQLQSTKNTIKLL